MDKYKNTIYSTLLFFLFILFAGSMAWLYDITYNLPAFRIWAGITSIISFAGGFEAWILMLVWKPFDNKKDSR